MSDFFGKRLDDPEKARKAEVKEKLAEEWSQKKKMRILLSIYVLLDNGSEKDLPWLKEAESFDELTQDKIAILQNLLEKFRNSADHIDFIMLLADIIKRICGDDPTVSIFEGIIDISYGWDKGEIKHFKMTVQDFIDLVIEHFYN